MSPLRAICMYLELIHQTGEVLPTFTRSAANAAWGRIPGVTVGTAQLPGIRLREHKHL